MFFPMTCAWYVYGYLSSTRQQSMVIHLPTKIALMEHDAWRLGQHSIEYSQEISRICNICQTGCYRCQEILDLL